MQKIVLEVMTRPIPSDNDILVYNKREECWVEIPKEDFLKEKTTEIKHLNEEIVALKQQNVEFKKQMSQMAKIIKERVL